MAVEVKIPEVGESIVEVQIGQWLKAKGDEVRKDEPLAVIESEKANFDLPAPEGGKLSRILCQAGQTVKVGATIAQIEPGGESGPPEPASAQTAEPPGAEATPRAEPELKAKTSPAPSKPERASTRTKESPPDKLKPELREELSPSEERPSEAPATQPEPPSAPAGQRRPLPENRPPLAAKGAPSKAEATPLAAPGREEEVVPMSMLRRTVARRLVEAQQTMAMLTTFNEVDMGAVQTLRQQRQQAFQQRYGIKLGLMSFFVKASIAALKELPQLNAEVRGDDIIYRNYFDIGVAIATPQGLVVPVLPNAERLSFAEVEKAVADFARRAKERQLKPEELKGGTFTITNGGVFGSLLSTPLINPPQSGILGLHAIADRPVAREGSVVIRPMMYVALTYDHRIVDGREAVLFLCRIKEVIEDPARMLIEA